MRQSRFHRRGVVALALLGDPHVAVGHGDAAASRRGIAAARVGWTVRRVRGRARRAGDGHGTLGSEGWQC